MPLILIAEDDPSTRSALADALESDGHSMHATLSYTPLPPSGSAFTLALPSVPPSP